ncbi:hypothetical protein K435DRAFT_810131 [Dendrothele bispora CBS 962.96]|uniref:Uncharacterized protein n=1 Tax=Dendrothele bispora (strain CBS 962.96) TaxID=1314807 RepID=A0A4S8KW24_DENBC|nr:hypothetical protein K435DRAFT_810131 [Dendrothele bispora CBS 962.96]
MSARPAVPTSIIFHQTTYTHTKSVKCISSVWILETRLDESTGHWSVTINTGHWSVTINTVTKEQVFKNVKHVIFTTGFGSGDVRIPDVKDMVATLSKFSNLLRIHMINSKAKSSIRRNTTSLRNG